MVSAIRTGQRNPARNGVSGAAVGQAVLAIQTANGAQARDDLTCDSQRFWPSFDDVALRLASTATCSGRSLGKSAFQVKPISAGALGLMRVMPATAKLAMRRGDLARHLGAGGGQVIERDLIIPERNIEIGSYHLAWLLKRYDNLRPLAIAAYNAGKSRGSMAERLANIPIDVWIGHSPSGKRATMCRMCWHFRWSTKALPAPGLSCRTMNG